MFQQIEEAVSDAIAQYLTSKFGVNVKVTLEEPKQSSFGELATPVAFQLARELKRSPKQIAQELVAELPKPQGVAALEIAGNGYINVRLDRAAYAASLIHAQAPSSSQSAGKVIVEHTNINPNKAAHIGHLRNAVLGDTFARMLRKSGRRVEVQNYIDNTGVQVADVVAGFHYLERKTAADVRALMDDPKLRFDYLCWDLYAQISSYYKEHPESLEWRHETLRAIEQGHGEIAELGHLVADAMVNAHLKSMYRLDVTYDVLPRESEILHLNFWSTAFELLKQRKAIHLETEGKNAGCWVMPASSFRDASPTANTADRAATDDSKVIVRSNGTVTYVGKDIAYQLWKFGLLGRDFFYRPWSSYPDGHQVWVTTDLPYAGEAPEFGHATAVFNVIDSRQAYLQDVVVAGLRALGFNQQADASVHFSYEMVALSPRTCQELGIELTEDDQRKTYVEVSGRKGLGIKADDLLDKLVLTALREVDDRHPAAPQEDRETVARQIAVGALRYFMLKFTRNSVIAFDLQEALSFEGETGPYVQYAALRADKILQKFAEREGALPAFNELLKSDLLERWFASDELWQLLLLASKSDVTVDRAIASGEPSHVARYAFQLSQTFNNFYHEHQVIGEKDRELRNLLLWLTGYVLSQLSATLTVLGIPLPQYM